MREQVIKFSVGQTSHGKQKLWALFDLMVGKRYPIPHEEENELDISHPPQENNVEMKNVSLLFELYNYLR